MTELLPKLTKRPPKRSAEGSSPSEPVRQVRLGRAQITLLGTAHISRASIQAVRAQIASGKYDAVAVELCASRHRTLTQPESWGETDLLRILREGRAGTLVSQLSLSAYQQRLADQLGVQPGAEMLEAIQATEEQGLPLWLIDREVGITLKRLLRGVPWTQRLALLGGLLTSFLSRDQVNEAEIERLKEGSLLESAFAEFAERSPALFNALITERDRYMGARLQQETADNAPHRILAIMGAGHLDGVANRLQQDQLPDPGAELAELDRVPPRRRWTRALPWIVVAVVIAGFVIGFLRSPELGLHLLTEWVVINGALSGVGAAIAGAHGLTILGAFLAAPITSLNPTIGASMVVGVIETGLKRPRVEDFNSLRHDVSRLRGWWHNRVARILLISVLAGVGSTIGSYVAGFRIVSQLVA